ncbi:ParB/RepB/Spo0J family partition protein [Sphingomonas histidinilytica]|jgi:ParB family chromosome partitioning protein|uniref:Chromosome partitioning protein, ParB family n=1 Tax=Rhizorhabdus histidinilytica TaxID=439228 RepID=A0A1T5DQ85_9SPHN|nr:ParB/RepB/Spo0J family partition protein [Rhizorhabdus histidinilytica]MBO9379252.1 ParB/RepB/Spo0J family partition protein [Rhizorhabdus histidinilytica]QEH80463.1 ParB/RepB/Spo0J family partition protein [Sphingomonas sp. C8-2]SKB73845.1 chromosome partitioning protein, ParB family [Rhizorhabdus histidinilytica]
MSADGPRRGLGRGLSSLLGEVATEQPIAPGAERPSGIRMIQVADIKPNPSQPRRHFDDTALDELAASIGARGLIQPIVVRTHPSAGGYQIIAGERRWRAAQRARIHELPAIVRELSDAQTFELAIVENVQRQDLNAIEEAEAYHRLIGDFGHTQEMLGKLVGKSRSHVANLMRLLDLPKPVRDMVADGRLSMGHARALVTAPNAEELAEQVVTQQLSVRDAEKLVQTGRSGGGAAPKPVAPRPAQPADADIAALERHLGDILGLKVTIEHGEKGGRIGIAYSTLDQLDLVCQRLSGEPI